jgi:hypothetical protein
MPISAIRRPRPRLVRSAHSIENLATDWRRSNLLRHRTATTREGFSRTSLLISRRGFTDLSCPLISRRRRRAVSIHPHKHCTELSAAIRSRSSRASDRLAARAVPSRVKLGRFAFSPSERPHEPRVGPAPSFGARLSDAGRNRAPIALLAVPQAGDEPEPLVHPVTLRPRHASLLWEAECHLCVRNEVLPLSQEAHLQRHGSIRSSI